jgi:hypothetical protein
VALLGSVTAVRLSSIHERLLEDRCDALPSLSNPFEGATAARIVIEQRRGSFRRRDAARALEKWLPRSRPTFILKRAPSDAFYSSLILNLINNQKN